MTELQVTEIYKSIQGESTWAGLPCVFIRLTGCPLRCRWCDTVYGFKGGEALSEAQILAKTKSYQTKVVELTGGEPLAQPGAISLMHALVKEKYDVLLETSGSEPIASVPKAVHIIMDIKCPDSGMSERNLWKNLESIKPHHEIKFVVASQSDFDWAVQITKQHDLLQLCPILISPAWGLVKPAALVDWIGDSGLPLRLNLQLHKFIWHPRTKGV